MKYTTLEKISEEESIAGSLAKQYLIKIENHDYPITTYYYNTIIKYLKSVQANTAEPTMDTVLKLVKLMKENHIPEEYDKDNEFDISEIQKSKEGWSIEFGDKVWKKLNVNKSLEEQIKISNELFLKLLERDKNPQPVYYFSSNCTLDKLEKETRELISNPQLAIDRDNTINILCISEEKYNQHLKYMLEIQTRLDDIPKHDGKGSAILWADRQVQNIKERNERNYYELEQKYEKLLKITKNKDKEIANYKRLIEKQTGNVKKIRRTVNNTKARDLSSIRFDKMSEPSKKKYNTKAKIFQQAKREQDEL